ncbi:hypothetical protein HMPREF9374_3424 [Desmospora sp. 8437]|nr:hypothetical protein HMPREF9374_3424 [Desmospora sp. 8437]
MFVDPDGMAYKYVTISIVNGHEVNKWRNTEAEIKEAFYFGENQLECRESEIIHAGNRSNFNYYFMPCFIRN